MAEIVTRFAPSPTGFLHIGGARTALFNALLAKQVGGQFRLRIEDTDRERSTQEAIEAILDGMKWLGLDWDGEVVYQSARADRHREVAEALLAKGLAYPCYATPEELSEMREKAMKEGRPPRYDGRWRDRDPSEAPKDRPAALRLKAPKEGETIIQDAVQGEVRFPNQDLDDLVLLRSDGTPTYMLAVVVDDHDMGVTDVVRGVDHLTNAARQQLIIEAMGWPRPRLAHVPLIHGPDGAKLSKRHGALGVDAYRAMGYLPDALCNYLVRLGWSHGDQEVFSWDEMVELFSLGSVGKSAARFDFAKLENLNGIYMRARDPNQLCRELEAVWPYLDGENLPTAPEQDLDRSRLALSMEGLQARAKTMVELAQSAGFLWAKRPLTLDEKASKLLGVDAPARLTEIKALLERAQLWEKEALETELRAFGEEHGLKLGKIAQPLRAALTGQSTSPGIFDLLVILGREESLARIDDVLSP